MSRLALAALATASLTGLAACGGGSDDISTKEGRAQFVKGCVSGAGKAGVTQATATSFCNCIVDELSKRGLNKADELKKAQEQKSAQYTAAQAACRSTLTGS